MIERVLFDGLWRGVFVTAIAYTVARTLPRRNAASQYVIWFAALLALIAVPAVAANRNFCRQLFPAHAAAVHSARLWITLAPLKSGIQPAMPSVLPWLLGIWIAGAALHIARLAVSFARIRAIMHGAEAYDQSDVFVSRGIAVPIAAGLRHARVILPATLIDELPEADVKRIIAHERAHIRRGDVAANAVQRCIQALLWFTRSRVRRSRRRGDRRRSRLRALLGAPRAQCCAGSACYSWRYRFTSHACRACGASDGTRLRRFEQPQTTSHLEELS